MATSINKIEHEQFRNIPPASLIAFATRAGWTKVKPYRNLADLYQATERSDLLIPRDAQIADYPRVVSELIRIFASDAEVDEFEIYRALFETDRDVVRMKIKETEGEGIPLSTASQMIEGLRKTLAAVASSLRHSKPVYSSSPPQEIREVLEATRIGHTEPGSFVIKVSLPTVTKPMKSLFPALEDDNPPLPRQLAVRLLEALTATKQATIDYATEEPCGLHDLINKGLSANFCEALSSIVRGVPRVDFELTWASIRPRPKLTETVVFQSEHSPFLLEAAKIFRDETPAIEQTFHGFVHKLTRTQEQDDGRVGFVTKFEGKKYTAEVDLSPSDYGRAIEAHKSKSLVEIEGDMVRTGQRWRIRNAQLLDILEDDSAEYAID